MRTLRSTLVIAAVALSCAAPAQALTVHVQSRPAIRHNVHLTGHAPRLAQGGYYYAVIVLEQYKRYTRNSPPPCSTSSNMQGTDYPRANDELPLTLGPTRSATGHWCRGGTYAGALYAVPHTPPCESAYPCSSEPPPPGRQCAGVASGCVLGIVARPGAYAYPDGLPTPRASGTAIVAHFTVKFAG
jgi:hypothetical protein